MREHIENSFLLIIILTEVKSLCIGIILAVSATVTWYSECEKTRLSSRPYCPAILLAPNASVDKNLYLPVNGILIHEYFSLYDRFLALAVSPVTSTVDIYDGLQLPSRRGVVVWMFRYMKLRRLPHTKA